MVYILGPLDFPHAGYDYVQESYEAMNSDVSMLYQIFLLSIVMYQKGIDSCKTS